MTEGRLHNHLRWLRHWSEGQHSGRESILLWSQLDATGSAEVTAIFVATMAASPRSVSLLALSWRRNFAAFSWPLLDDFFARFLSDISAGVFSHIVPDDGGLDSAVAAVTAVLDRDRVFIHVVDCNRRCDVVDVMNCVVGRVNVVDNIVAFSRTAAAASMIVNVDVDVWSGLAALSAASLARLYLTGLSLHLRHIRALVAAALVKLIARRASRGLKPRRRCLWSSYYRFRSREAWLSLNDLSSRARASIPRESSIALGRSLDTKSVR